jgi:hypothetical protein
VRRSATNLFDYLLLMSIVLILFGLFSWGYNPVFAQSGCVANCRDCPNTLDFCTDSLHLSDCNGGDCGGGNCGDCEFDPEHNDCFCPDD